MAQDGDTRPRRRTSDGDGYSLEDRVNQLAEDIRDHIRDCSSQSKRLFWAVLAVLGWLVAHTLPFFDKIKI